MSSYASPDGVGLLFSSGGKKRVESDMPRHAVLPRRMAYAGTRGMLDSKPRVGTYG